MGIETLKAGNLVATRFGGDTPILKIDSCVVPRGGAVRPIHLALFGCHARGIRAGSSEVLNASIQCKDSAFHGFVRPVVRVTRLNIDIQAALKET